MFESPTRRWTVRDLMRVAIDSLNQRGIPESRLTVELLLAHALQKARIELYTGFDTPLNSTELASFRTLVQRRLRGEPVQYIVGSAHFMGLAFHVDPRVLIPRPETETLVESSLLYVKDHPASEHRIIDIGAGSGNIGVALAKFVANSRVVATDLSEAALDVAKDNAHAQKVAERMDFHVWDVREGPPGWLRQGFDIIVSNPPYIPLVEWESLDAIVRDHEPQRALTDGADGLGIIRRIIDVAPQLLRRDGPVLLEVGHDQAPAVQRLFRQVEATSIVVIRDMQNVERVVSAVCSPSTQEH